MKTIIGFSFFFSFLFASCSTELPISIFDTCQDDGVSFLTIENGTSDASMDIYLDGIYIITLAPQGQHFLDRMKVGKYELEGRESNGFRIWVKDVAIEEICQDAFVAIGQ